MIDAGLTTAGTVKITEEKWLYTLDYKIFFGLIISLVVLTQLNAICRTNKVQNKIRKCRGQTPLSDDDFAKLADEEQGQKQPTNTKPAANAKPPAKPPAKPAANAKKPAPAAPAKKAPAANPKTDDNF